MVREYSDRTILYFANIGDTRAILNRGGKALRLTKDHTVFDEDEKSRLAASSAYKKSHQQVKSLVRQTRSFGDHALKQWVISAPHFAELELSPGDSQILLISHKLCEMMEDQEMVDIAVGEGSRGTAWR